MVETENGEWYAVHLCGRPMERYNPPDAKRFPGQRRYILGRETAIQPMVWTRDGWLRPANGTILPDVEVEMPPLPPCPWELPPVRESFDEPSLRIPWQSLRVPLPESSLSLTARKGYLRLYGGDGLGSRFAQSLIAQRLTELSARAQACVAFEPTIFKQMAGLILYYDYDNYFYLHITHDESLGKVIALLTAENKVYAYPAGYHPVPEGQRIHLRLTLTNGDAQFAYSIGDEEHFADFGPVLDASILSDEACVEGWFTGTMVGLCCQDLTGFSLPADFSYFDYEAVSEA